MALSRGLGVGEALRSAGAGVMATQGAAAGSGRSWDPGTLKVCVEGPLRSHAV